MQIPDAPWIRDAENNGVPDGDIFYCPVCGAEDPEWFFAYKGDTTILGCNECIDRIEPYDVEA